MLLDYATKAELKKWIKWAEKEIKAYQKFIELAKKRLKK